MTANAIKAILATAKRLEKKLARVEVRSISDLKNYIKSIKRNLKKFEARLRKIKKSGDGQPCRGHRSRTGGSPVPP